MEIVRAEQEACDAYFWGQEQQDEDDDDDDNDDEQYYYNDDYPDDYDSDSDDDEYLYDDYNYNSMLSYVYTEEAAETKDDDDDANDHEEEDSDPLQDSLSNFDSFHETPCTPTSSSSSRPKLPSSLPLPITTTMTTIASPGTTSSS